MQEQPPSDPPRREPAAGARRARSAKPTFTPPPAPEPPLGQAEAGGETTPRPRRAKVPPTVIFQPPDPAQATPRAAGSGPTPDGQVATPRPRPAAEAVPRQDTTGASGTRDTPPSADPSDGGPADEEAPKRTGRTSARTATPPEETAPATEKAAPAKKAAAAKNAASAARKRAGSAPAEAVERTGGSELPERIDQRDPAGPGTTARPDRAGPTGPDSAAGTAAVQADDPERASGEAGTADVSEAPTEQQAPTRTGRARKATKAAPAKRTGPARKSAQPESPQVTVTAPGPLAEAAPGPARTSVEGWRAAGARLLDHPGFAPELLALAAVDALGPHARDWVERARRAYPDADADGLARLVTRRFVRLAGAGGAFAAGAGLLAPLAELAAVLWAQANLVLHLAAAYGRDPGHPDRVAELLVLTRVHPDVGTARAALDAVRSAGAPTDGPWPRAAEAAWRLATPLAAQAGGWLGLRVASRLLPGAAMLAAAAGDSAAAERLAARAIGRYRPVRAS
ncbi:hypothetical protein [Micromonospora sp. SL4-19]|uniref:hypothetical protein n=1 Tax=Micromonospora sp. SL4-19 TaxID=3399129 RepID=UPI003A4D7C4F